MFEQHMPQPDPLYTCGRPIPDAMAQVEVTAAKVAALIDGWRAAGEITVNFDALGIKNAITARIQLPKD